MIIKLLLQFLLQLIHNLFRGQLNFSELQKIILIPFLIQHTNERRLFLHTLSQIYD